MMKKVVNGKSFILAAALAGLMCSSSVFAGFQSAVIGETKGGFTDRDLENGLVANASVTLLGTRISLFDDGQETIIVDSASVKSNVNISNGITYWTEIERINDEFVVTLYSFVDDVVTAITDSATRKSGFSYDDSGNVAWVEQVNNANEIFFYDGVTITQITSGNVGFSISDFSKNINVAGGSVVWGQSGGYHLWDGETTVQVTPAEHSLKSAVSFDGDSIVWLASTSTVSREVFQYNAGVVTQLTNASNSPGGIKINPLLEDGVITFQRSLSSLSFVPKELYVFGGDESVLLSTSSVNDAQVDNGKIFWTEGSAADTPVDLFEYSDGVTSQIATAPGLIVALEADGGHLIWNVVGHPNPVMLTLASPVNMDSPDVVNLGPVNMLAAIDLSEGVTIEVEAGSHLNWSANTITFGFTTDELSLDGLVAFDSAGNAYDLSGYWTPISLPFSAEPLTLTIPAQPGRTIYVEWWASA